MKTRHYNPQRPKIQQTKLKKEAALQKKTQEPFIEPHKQGTWNTILDATPTDVASRRIQLPTTGHRTTHDTITPKRKQFLFLNLKDEALLRFMTGQSPPWVRLFQNELSRKGNKGFFENLPIVLKAKRRQLIKEVYFNPGKPTVSNPWLFTETVCQHNPETGGKHTSFLGNISAPAYTSSSPKGDWPHRGLLPRISVM